MNRTLVDNINVANISPNLPLLPRDFLENMNTVSHRSTFHRLLL